MAESVLRARPTLVEHISLFCRWATMGGSLRKPQQHCVQHRDKPLCAVPGQTTALRAAPGQSTDHVNLIRKAEHTNDCESHGHKHAYDLLSALPRALCTCAHASRQDGCGFWFMYSNAIVSGIGLQFCWLCTIGKPC